MVHLAQVNIAQLVAPLASEELAGFVEALDAVNAAADAAPGFVWRLKDETGCATAIEGFPDDVESSPGVIVNLSVWRDLDALRHYVYSPAHVAVLRRRREWFSRLARPTTVCWPVQEGHQPSIAEAEERMAKLRAEGPSPQAFSLAYDAAAVAH